MNEAQREGEADARKLFEAAPRCARYEFWLGGLISMVRAHARGFKSDYMQDYSEAKMGEFMRLVERHIA